MSTKEQLEALTEEVKKLREEVQRANAWPHTVYVPQPYYVPWYPAPQPAYPYWYTITVHANQPTLGNQIQWTNCTAAAALPTTTTFTVQS